MPSDAVGPGLLRPSGNMRWVVIIWLFVISAVSYLDRNNLSIAGGAIKKDFALTDVQLGGVFSAFAFGYAFNQPIAGKIADKLGAYRTVALAILWWSVFTALTPMVPPGIPHALTILIIVRLLLGIGEAVIYPAGNRLVAAWIPSSERGFAERPDLRRRRHRRRCRAAARHVSDDQFRLAVGVHRQRRHRPCGRAVLAGGGSQHAARAPPRYAGGIALHRGGSGRPPPPIRRRSGMASYRRRSPDSAVAASYFCFGYVAYIFFSWFFIYLSTVRGLDLKSSAILAMLPFIAMTVFSTARRHSVGQA